MKLSKVLRQAGLAKPIVRKAKKLQRQVKQAWEIQKLYARREGVIGELQRHLHLANEQRHQLSKAYEVLSGRWRDEVEARKVEKINLSYFLYEAMRRGGLPEMMVKRHPGVDYGEQIKVTPVSGNTYVVVTADHGAERTEKGGCTGFTREEVAETSMGCKAERKCGVCGANLELASIERCTCVDDVAVAKAADGLDLHLAAGSEQYGPTFTTKPGVDVKEIKLPVKGQLGQ